MQHKSKRHVTLKKHSSTEPQQNPPINETLSLIQQHFPIGSKIEVRSDDEGFRGAWFLATVLPSPLSSPKPDKIYVEYATLFKGSDFLREFVDVNLVRPKPPVELVNFQVKDVVDAYYQEGWWSGVITEVIEANSKYRVLFSDPTHELVFGLTDLRLQGCWIDGFWVSPPNQRMSELKFSPLTAVEVTIDPDTSRDIWHPAVVVERANNYSYLVKYQSSREHGFQKAAVDPHHIRPPPPGSGIKTFGLLEKVDAFCDCRWLSGIVTKILANGQYTVYFKCIKEEKELRSKDLRLHMEWINNKWVRSSLDTSVTSKSDKWSVSLRDGNKDKIFAPNRDSVVMKECNGQVKISPVSLRHPEKALQTSGSEEANCISTTPGKKRDRQANVDSNANSLRPSRRTNDEEAECDARLSPETCKSNVMRTVGFDTPVAFDTLEPDHQGEFSMKQSEDDRQPYDSAIIKSDYEKNPMARKSGRPRKLHASMEVADTVDQTPTRSDLVKSYGPVVLGLTLNVNFIDSKAVTPGRRHKMNKVIVDEEQQLAATSDPDKVASKEIEPQKEGKISKLKRKRGRPPKVVAQLGNPTNTEAAVPESVFANMEVSAAEVEKVSAAVNLLLTSDARTNVNIVSDQFKQLADIRRLHFGKRSTTKRQVRRSSLVSIAAVELANACTSSGHKLRSINQGELSTKGNFAEAEDSSSKETVENPDNGVCLDITAIAVTSGVASDDDQPLSVWLEGAHPPAAPDGGQVVETEEVQDEIEAPPCGLPDKAQEENNEASVENKDATKRQEEEEKPIENQVLPFIKKSPIWGVIESMEVLKRIPQNPHFQPLHDYKEECREGLAIGNMVTFTSLAEKVCGASFDEPKSVLNGYLEALVDLEELGFNVAVLREVLDKLISIKSTYEQAQSSSKEKERQMMEGEEEKSKIGDEIAELEKKIMELKEKQGVAVSKKEKKESEIALLKKSYDAVKDSLKSAHDEFEKVTATLRFRLTVSGGGLD